MTHEKTAATDPPLILIAEDNERNTRLLTEMLTANGYRVCTADDGPRALAAARSLQPHLILMDLQLPKLDGVTITRSLKAASETAHIPIIAVTAQAMNEHRTSMLDAGCWCYITKPVSYRPLLEAVAGALRDSGVPA